ncbi:MAG: hypothetical protein MRZ79_20925 [Bacteroidia bacterium]|nr:hypothetical protein [Bacteroidia bacterium]
MKKYFKFWPPLGATILAFMLFVFGFQPAESPHKSSIEGAWRLDKIEGRSTESVGIQMVKILSDGYFMFAYFNESTQQFFSSGGGTYTFYNGIYTEKIEFHTINPEIIGKTVKFQAEFNNGRWIHKGMVAGEQLSEEFTRIDGTDVSPIAGAWILEQESGQEGRMAKLKPKGRKRIKLLSDSQFQWVEYDQKKGDFIAAGGGTYSHTTDKYVEELKYFSQDSTWVGRKIGFTFREQNGRWFHKEWSSRGKQPIDEIWKKIAAL